MKKKYYPFVSICTPTFNRRPFIENIIQCYKNQTYPKSRMEWIVVDDGTDKVQDVFMKHKIPNFKYFAAEKMNLGGKRNFMHTKTKGSIIVYMDDDDYYPPDRVEHAVERLQENPNALCAGSSELYVYFKTLKKMVQFGPYGPNHSTAGTFAFRKTLLDKTQYDDHAALAEERAFLQDYTIPFVQLDPLKTILVFSHEHNTFDKRKMFDQKQDPKYFKESSKTVDTFIQNEHEINIKKFFMEDIDALLDKYDPGKPEMKPDVLKQIKEIEAKRAQMIKDHEAQQQSQNGPIMLTREGQPPVQLTNQQVVQIMGQHKQQILDLTKKNEELQRFTQLLQQKVIELNKTNKPPLIASVNKHEIEGKEQLIAQISALTKRNEFIETQLTSANTTIATLQSKINN